VGERDGSAEARFRSVYANTYPDVLRFLARRAPMGEAEDVAAETFLVVWRRLASVPTSDDTARAWIFGIARHVLLNARRGEGRRQALSVRLADPAVLLSQRGLSDVESWAPRIYLAKAWQSLSAVDQEVLAMT